MKHIMSALVSVAVAFGAAAQIPVSKSRFIDINAHAIVGGSYFTNNYESCYSEINTVNSSMGLQYGVGVGVKFNIRRHISLGTELNFTSNSGKMNMAVINRQTESGSYVFQSNRYYGIDIPVYITFKDDFSSNVSWNVDAGMYYYYGTGGSQKNIIFDGKTNDLGQLITSVTKLKADYYDDSDAFINSSRRADIGLHLGAGLLFYNHFSIGIRTHIGFKNTAKSTGIVAPSNHNFNFAAIVGWQF